MKHIRIWTVLAACCLMVLCGCKTNRPLKMAQSNETESVLLSEMVRLLAEQEGREVEVVRVEGGTSDIHPAIAGHTLDLYPEYTGTAWINVLRKDPPYRAQNQPELEEEYEKLGLTWQGMSGVEDVYTLAVTPETAAKYNLKTLSDLSKVADQLVLGADSSWLEREDASVVLSNSYAMNFKETKNLPEDMQYQQLKRGRIDVMPVHSTDGRLKAGKMIALEDDRDVYSHSMLGFVTSETALRDYEWLESVLNTIGQNLTTEDMVMLKNQVDSNGWNPTTAARGWLQTRGLLPVQEDDSAKEGTSFFAQPAPAGLA